MELAIVVYYINILWDIIKNWWWIFVPFVLWRHFKFWWFWWRLEVWMFQQKMIVLEIKMPKDVLKPLRAMEEAFDAIWANLLDPPDWWEKWFEGKQQISITLEMVSDGGTPHLYIRTIDNRRNAIESAIYSQYPDAEITLVDDYTNSVPQSLPNKDWNLWGADFELVRADKLKADLFPIKTYNQFFEEKEVAKEEKRIDPISVLLEGMGTFKPGEQLWIQICLEPILNSGKPEEGGRKFIKEGRAMADKLAKRPVTETKSILREAVDELISGTAPGEKKEEPALYPPEMRLTPGEKDIVTAVERKISKRCFKAYFRFIYLAKRDVYLSAAKSIPFGFFNQFSTENLNNFKPMSRTLSKVHKYITLKFFNIEIPIPTFEILRARRGFVRRRRLFFRYTKRFSPFFPKSGGTYLLNTEEAATMFHFPGRGVSSAPSVSRVESKRGEAPLDLPMEE
ncbi:MAG: hypothetical protein ABIB55_02205 [Candidatus Nealsonbacteria bacterium]